eukprot:SRR837773.26426.p1 GENE.SRR837773.26426~~SRR837773.26426.p1  ORF type:complete len:113 (+),score=24.44 SRR837773.26426:42-380(+)
MALARATTQAMRLNALPAKTVQTAQRRFVGGNAEELAAGTSMWLKSSVIGLLVFTIPFSVYMGYVESTHESHHENIVYPHMKKRAKKFPWTNGECDLFDSECHKEAAKAAQA